MTTGGRCPCTPPPIPEHRMPSFYTGFLTGPVQERQSTSDRGNLPPLGCREIWPRRMFSLIWRLVIFVKAMSAGGI
jgi:hypothetical protein